MSWITKVWQIVSNNGISVGTRDTIKRTTVLNNQVNATLFLIMGGISLFLWVLRLLEDRTINIGGWRFFWVMGLCVLHFILAKNKYHTLSKSILIFIPPILFLIVPSFYGFVENQSYFYYPYIIVAFSIFPQLLLRFKTNRFLYIASMLYYFVFVFSIDFILVYLGPEDLEVISILKQFWIYNKIAAISIYVFINSSVYYLKWLNYQYEMQLKANQEALLINNQKLDIHIEELKATNENLKDTQHQLIQSEKMASLGVLTAGVAHEINTPLNFISTGSLLINNAIEDSKNGVSQEEVNSLLIQGNDIIDKGIEQAAFIVSSLMTFSYSGKSKKELHDLNAIIDSTLMFLKAKIPTDLVINKSYELDRHVDVYADKIHQIVINILDNSITAVAECSQKELDIRTYIETLDAQSLACIAIVNNGPHIAKDVGSRIFDPFFTTKSINQGTGLGLSLAYNLVEEHHGRLSFTNKTEGVEFLIMLPLK